MNKSDIDKCINDSSVILRGVLADVINTNEPAGFIIAERIMECFKERMLTWGRFEHNKIATMTEEVKSFLGRLKTVKNKADEEGTCVKTIYNRCERGVYKMIEIDGVKFILED